MPNMILVSLPCVNSGLLTGLEKERFTTKYIYIYAVGEKIIWSPEDFVRLPADK